MKFIITLIQALSLAAMMYFSAALAFQVSSGGDVEYYISIFIFAAALIFALTKMQKA